MVHLLCADNTVRDASSGDNVQIGWQDWHFVTCDSMKIDGSLARNIDFGVANFGVHEEHL